MFNERVTVTCYKDRENVAVTYICLRFKLTSQLYDAARSDLV